MSPSSGRHPGVGVVVIGRNEGERLRRCLESVRGAARAIVYVDSGSTDGSVALADRARRDRGRARHAPAVHRRPRPQRGRAARLQAIAPDLAFVQFVDGDCEMRRGLARRGRALPRRRAAGRRRLRPAPRALPGAIGLQPAVRHRMEHADRRSPGLRRRRDDARPRPCARSSGFRDDLIAGEEPELCVRLRAKGWKIWRLDAEMTLHDAAMTRFGQWWRRNVRAGFAYAEGVRLHGAPPERHWVREWRSAWFWGAVTAACHRPRRRARRPGRPLGVRDLSAAGAAAGDGGCAVSTAAAGRAPSSSSPASFPEALGQAKSWLLHRRRQQAVLIEYK